MLMSVGNAFLDAEHKKQIDMIGEVENAIKARDTAAFTLAFQRFSDAIRIHFSNEEKIADAIGHSFDQHRLEHQYVLNELQRMKAELIGMADKWSESASIHYLFFLSTWASEHIDQDDMLMKLKLQSLPYDFRPDELIES